MRKIALLLISVLAIAGLSSVFGGAEDDMIQMNQKRTEEALRQLANGSAHEKYLAALYMGASKNPRFVRPLGRELLQGWKDPKAEREPGSNDIRVGCGPQLGTVCPPAATQDPYVKAGIAWALGEIGHEQGVGFLKEAMSLASDRVETEIKRTTDARAKLSGGEYRAQVVLDRNVAGPAQLRQGYVYPFSPDVHWSQAEDFKAVISIDEMDEANRMRLEGYNYVNVTASILQALGKIKNPGALESIKAYLDHPIPSIRGFAVLAAGYQGRPALSLLLAQAEKEKDKKIQTRIARAVLLVDKSQLPQYKLLLKLLKDREKGVRIESINAFRELAMGEAVDELKEALKIEEDETLRGLLKDAIHNAEIDNILPVNY